jgi:hypothetical protein
MFPKLVLEICQLLPAGRATAVEKTIYAKR